MSGALYVAIMAGEVGFAMGVGSTLLVLGHRRPGVAAAAQISEESADHQLWDEPAREAVATEFATHSAGVGRQLSEFADVLAGGDQLLRERLRRIEQHTRRRI